MINHNELRLTIARTGVLFNFLMLFYYFLFEIQNWQWLILGNGVLFIMYFGSYTDESRQCKYCKNELTFLSYYLVSKSCKRCEINKAWKEEAKRKKEKEKLDRKSDLYWSRIK